MEIQTSNLGRGWHAADKVEARREKREHAWGLPHKEKPPDCCTSGVTEQEPARMSYPELTAHVSNENTALQTFPHLQ
jgi:hypothetical protein